MDAEFPQPPVDTDRRVLIRERIGKLEAWLAQHGGDCDQEQAHLDEGSRERAYWHYGYLSALRDVLRLLDGPVASH